MEDVSPTTETVGQRCDELVQALAAQRSRVQSFIASHQRRLRQAETDLAAQVALIGEELGRDQRRTTQAQSETAEVQAKVAEVEAELALGRRKLESALEALRHDERELDRRRREHEADVEELARRRQELQKKLAEVEKAGEALAAERHETTLQRRRIADELKARRETRFKEFERQRNETRHAHDKLQHDRDELDRDVAEKEAKLALGRKQLESALAGLRHDERELDRRRREHQADLEEFALRRQRQQEKLAEIEQASEAIAAERHETKLQRRRIAGEFKAQREARLREFERQRVETRQARDELDHERLALGDARSLAAELELQRRQCATLEQQLAERAESLDEAERRLQALTADFESLQRRLKEAFDQRRPAEEASETAQVDAKVAEGMAELALGRQQLESALDRLRRDERELDRRRREHEADVEELARRRQQQQEKLAEIEHASEALATERRETKLQRRRIAVEFKSQREARLREYDRQRDELDRERMALGEARSLAVELDLQRRQSATLEQQLAERAEALEAAERRLHASAADFESLQRRLTEALDQRRAAEEASDKLRDDRDWLDRERMALADAHQSLETRLNAALDTAKQAAGGDAAAFDAERDRLVESLGETERRLTETERLLAQAQQRVAEAPSAECAHDLADMKRRYEMALDDLRELRQRCAEQEKKLAQAPKPSAGAAVGDGMDWEAQKRRMLASLEADDEDDDGDERRRDERLQLHDVIAKTDAALANKEQELEEMRRLLAAPSADLDAKTAGAAEFDHLLSSDEIVREERERLQRLQLEWEEKLRQAEVDLSIERAKMARERAQLEERQRHLQDLQAQQPKEPVGDAKERKPQRGRWLARLGLKDDEPR